MIRMFGVHLRICTSIMLSDHMLRYECLGYICAYIHRLCCRIICYDTDIWGSCAHMHIDYVVASYVTIRMFGVHVRNCTLIMLSKQMLRYECLGYMCAYIHRLCCRIICYNTHVWGTCAHMHINYVVASYVTIRIFGVHVRGYTSIMLSHHILQYVCLGCMCAYAHQICYRIICYDTNIWGTYAHIYIDYVVESYIMIRIIGVYVRICTSTMFSHHML